MTAPRKPQAFRIEPEPTANEPAPEAPAQTRRPRAIKSASVLQGGEVEWQADGGGLRLALPGTLRHPIDTVVKLELDGTAMDIAPR